VRAGKRGASARAEWEARLATSAQKSEFERRMAGELPAGDEGMNAYIEACSPNPQKVATRKASRNGAGSDHRRGAPEMIGGSADLTGSNNTKTKATTPFRRQLCGRYVYYGIREHRHGGGDERHGAAWRRHSLWRHVPRLLGLYCRRRSACRRSMGQRVIYVMTHDSIGLGEDGPTHQPVEHVMRRCGDPQP
jgi:transketolase